MFDTVFKIMQYVSKCVENIAKSLLLCSFKGQHDIKFDKFSSSKTEEH